MFRMAVAWVLVAAAAGSVWGQTYDVVVAGGRVIDPESGLDAVRDVGIRDRRIAAISELPLEGTARVDAAGLVVSPGFIDLHAHGQALDSRILQVQDGVTTALELEIGVYPVAPWYASQEGTSPVNYGATVGHLPVRVKAMDGRDIGHLPTLPMTVREELMTAQYATTAATDEQIEAMAGFLQEGLDEGALGIGFGIGYVPVASHAEILRMFRVSAANGAVSFVHMRSNTAFDDKEYIGPVQEVLADVAATGTAAHIVHLNSSGSRQAKLCLEMIRGANARGMDVTTEAYPYTASSTMLQSALFDGDWEGNTGLKYHDIMWVQTGERLTAETFEKYRKIGGWVVVYGMDEDVVSWLIAQPDVTIASDGIPFVNGKAHPRGAGTFSRFLGHYARDGKLMALPSALKKITLDPARRLEAYCPAMKTKGRIQLGADGDLVIFDAEKILDRATFMEPAQGSAGIAHVLVNGTFVVRDGKYLEGVYPGTAVRND